MLFLTDFRELNSNLGRNSIPLPRIDNIISSFDSFTYTTKLDLSIGYYHFSLDNESKNLSTISLTWGNYRYKRLPMGIMPTLDVFQSKMNSLFYDLDYVKVYINDILIMLHNNKQDHLNKVNKVLERLQESYIKVKMQKFTFLQLSVDCLGFKLNKDGIHPLQNNIEALAQMGPPTTRKQLKGFHDTTVLTDLTSPKTLFRWDIKVQ